MERTGLVGIFNIVGQSALSNISSVTIGPFEFFPPLSLTRFRDSLSRFRFVIVFDKSDVDDEGSDASELEVLVDDDFDEVGSSGDTFEGRPRFGLVAIAASFLR